MTKEQWKYYKELRDSLRTTIIAQIDKKRIEVEILTPTFYSK